MMKRLSPYPLLTFFLFAAISTGATNQVDINLDVKHSVNGHSQFDRQKYITMHAETTGSDWDAPSAQEKMDIIFDELDVYLGRNNGGIVWWANQMEEDPNRSGYALVSDIENKGADQRPKYDAEYGKKFDARADIMIGGQPQAMWPEEKDGWKWANGEAVGEFMAHYVNEFYRPIDSTDVSLGEPAPRFVEIMNEPLYALLDDGALAEEDKVPPIEVFEFHREVANGFKQHNTTSLIGGFTTAFPEFDIDDFNRWDERMKLFLDTAGAEMDFISLHFYDFHRHWVTGNTGHLNFKGSRMDATLDMVENYSQLALGTVKPILISEYGGRDHSTEKNTWSAERDWTFMKAFTPMLLSYMERPDTILKTIPFIVTSFDWYGGEPPYPWRMLRKADEPESYTGDWVFTEMIKLYELWSDVNGTRVDTWTTNPDIKTDAYVDGNKAYLILSNLSFESQAIDLSMYGQQENSISSIRVKHMFADNQLPVLEETTVETLETFTIAPEAAAVIEYTFTETLAIDHLIEEKKFYGNVVKQPILEYTPIAMGVSVDDPSNTSEAILTVSFGREKELSKRPQVTFNGITTNVPDNFSGDNFQDAREGFFGQLDIPIPADLVQENNSISIVFPDSGGFVSSVSLRTFTTDSTTPLERPDQVTALSVYPEAIELGIDQSRQLTASISPVNARDIRIEWTSSNDAVATVDPSGGKVIGKGVGEVTVTATTNDGGFSKNIPVTVQAQRVAVEVDTVSVTPQSASIINEASIQLSATVLPIDADEPSVTWTSGDSTIATVDETGFVTGVSDGTTSISATTSNDVSDSATITSQTLVPGTVAFDNKRTYLDTVYKVGEELEVNCTFTTTTGRTVNDEGVKFWLRQIRANWTVEKNYTTFDTSAAGKSEGTATGTISLEGITPSDELPTGHFYFLWVTYTEDDGNTVSEGASASPITIAR